MFADADWRVPFGEQVAFHEVDADEKFVSAVDAAQVFSRATSKLRETCAGPNEDGVVAALFHEFGDCVDSADEVAKSEVDAEALDVVDFVFDDSFGQAKFGDAVAEHSAANMQGFKHGYVVTLLDKVSRDC